MSTNQTTTSKLDGLCIVGELIAVEQVKGKNGQFLDGLARATVRTSRGDERVDLARVSRGLTGDVQLPAFDKLIQGVGHHYVIAVGIRKSGDNNQYTNYTAIDAERL
jgi:hypothetical protein